MKIRILQHTPNEGPGFIRNWGEVNGHDIYTYHPYFFKNVLPTEQQTDLLIILGGPMSPNDSEQWIADERALILDMLKADKPILGICYGAQQITKALGYTVTKSPVKEVGWDKVFLKSETIKNLSKELMALHWHEETFQIPEDAQLLFSSKHLQNQGFLLKNNVVGLQFHLEPTEYNLHEIVKNDYSYVADNVLQQTAEQIINHSVSEENRRAIFAILDYITKKTE